MLIVKSIGQFHYVFHQASKRWWKACFRTYAEATGCISRVEADWQASEGNRDRDLKVNFVENRNEVLEARMRSV